MGATHWSYFTPYQDDIEKALHELRNTVFANGDYYLLPRSRPVSKQEFIERYEGSGLLEEHDLENAAEEYQALKKGFDRPVPTTIDELLEWNHESGTHSIIDMLFVSYDASNSDYSTVKPLSDDQLYALFGTHTPDRESVQAKAQEIADLRGQWEGSFIVVFENDQPKELFFCGTSGG